MPSKALVLAGLPSAGEGTPGEHGPPSTRIPHERCPTSFPPAPRGASRAPRRPAGHGAQAKAAPGHRPQGRARIAPSATPGALQPHTRTDTHMRVPTHTCVRAHTAQGPDLLQLSPTQLLSPRPAHLSARRSPAPAARSPQPTRCPAGPPQLPAHPPQQVSPQLLGRQRGLAVLPPLAGPCRGRGLCHAGRQVAGGVGPAPSSCPAAAPAPPDPPSGLPAPAGTGPGSPAHRTDQPSPAGEAQG